MSKEDCLVIWHAVGNKSTKHNVINMGMFYLHAPDMKANEVFPKDVPEKICIAFTCKGRECTNENCHFAHLRNAIELQKGTVNTKYHLLSFHGTEDSLVVFMKMNNLNI